MIGLREFRETYKGASFTYKVKELWWQLRYAWQRAWRGYDYMDTFELCFRFRERIVPILKDFRENNVGLFYDSEKHRNLTLTSRILPPLSTVVRRWRDELILCSLVIMLDRFWTW